MIRASDFGSVSTLGRPAPSNPFATKFTRPGATPYRFRLNGRWVDPLGTKQEQAIEELLVQLRGSRCGAIVGPHGTGKSTLLATLDPSFHRAFGLVRSHTLRDETSVEVIDARGVAALEPNEPELSGIASSGLQGSELRRSELRRPGLKRAWIVAAWQDRARRRSCEREILSFLRGIGVGDLAVIEGAEQLSVACLGRLARKAKREDWYLLVTAHAEIPFVNTIYRTAASSELVELLAEQLIADCPREIAAKVTAQLSARDLSRVSNLRELWFELYDVVQDHLIRSAG